MKQQDKILQFVLSQDYVISHQVKRYGLDNFVGCPDRRLRELITAGKVERLTKLEAQMKGYTGKEACYRAVHKETQLEVFA